MGSSIAHPSPRASPRGYAPPSAAPWPARTTGDQSQTVMAQPQVLRDHGRVRGVVHAACSFRSSSRPRSHSPSAARRIRIVPLGSFITRGPYLVPVHLGEREDLASGIAGAAGAEGGPDADGLRDVHAGIGRVKFDAALRLQHDLPVAEGEQGSAQRRGVARAEQPAAFAAGDPAHVDGVEAALVSGSLEPFDLACRE